MPNRHMLADMLTKQVKPTKMVEKSLYENHYSAVPSQEEELQEQARVELRSIQRERRRDRKNAAKADARAAAEATRLH